MLAKKNKNQDKSLIAKSFLQSGQPLPITNYVSFKHPTIQEVLELDKEHLGLHSEEYYYSMIGIFLTDPYQFMVYLDDKGIDYETVTPYQVFVMRFKDRMKIYEEYHKYNPNEDIKEAILNDIYFRTFKFFFGVEKIAIAQLSETETAVVSGDLFLFDEESYNYIFDFIKSMNGIPEIDKIYPEDEWAKQILIEDERERLKKQAKKADEDNSNKDRLGNLISAVTWACNGGVTPFNRNQLHMYDLIDGLHRTNKLLNYNHTTTGIYSGCVDQKKINLKELHWSL
jgi:hypothetical protein